VDAFGNALFEAALTLCLKESEDNHERLQPGTLFFRSLLTF